MSKEKYYITTAIAYASGKPHFGNTYEAIATDAIARYKRQRGYDVRFMTGTDEHGQKVQNLAEKAGITPQAYVDNVSSQIKDLWKYMNVSEDYFIRTTDSYHKTAVEHIFKKLYDQGDIYKGYYEGLYCTPCESFFTETQLVDGKCPDCGREVTKTKEEAYFFKMSKYADRLMKHIEENPDFIQPESRKKEMINNFLKPGLQDLCVSRTSFNWGVSVTFDPKHVIYVWIDALSNYITGLGYDPDNEEQPELFKKYWPADVHIIGKDIVRFHTIYWPIMLMALGVELPKKVFGHPWFNFGFDKMSKSKGNVVYADELANRFGVDGVRYYAISEMPYANDGSITYENIINRYNTDLANNLGNLLSRTIAMTKKYFGGTIPQNAVFDNEFDNDLKAKAIDTVSKFTALMDDFKLAEAAECVFDMLSRANKYIDETTPWILAKDENQKERLGTVLYNLLETLRFGAVLLYPFIPATSEEIFKELNTSLTEYESISSFGGLESGKDVGEQKVLFQRIDEAKMLAEIEAEIAKKMEAEKVIEKPEGCAIIGIDKFMEVELRTAEVLECEAVPKAKKLLKLQLDLGYEKRQVVSGIAKFYKPEDLIGKKVIVVANLSPAKLCGIESNGMILASGEETIRVVFLDKDTPNGERVH
ncbi:MAG: methionine--tRNA ligase [Ruminococcaceae bacterium]|nr:methionine--tRNA ligase [Oscillospiraceae bacterium]